jgi:hypothetical protein
VEREPEALLETWFGPDPDSPEAVDERFRTGFGGGPDFDALLRERHGDWPDVARVHPIEAIFLHLPLEHAEDARAQRECVEGFGALRDGAPGPCAPRWSAPSTSPGVTRSSSIASGASPHRNAALGRTSTAEELRYLEQGGETFS